MVVLKPQSAAALTERHVDLGEIDDVMDFLRANWDRHYLLGNDGDFLAWQFAPARCRGFENAGLSVVGLRDQSELVGMVGLIGCRFNHNGVVVDGAWLCNLVVLPDFRGAGGWMRLMRYVHRLPLGIVAAIVFPPDIQRLYSAMGYCIRDRLFRFLRIVDPEQMAQLVEGDAWRVHVQASNASPRSSNLKIEQATSLDERWDRFWRRFVELGYFGIDRDASYMLWRYLRHPRFQYAVKVAFAPDGEIRGAAVYRIEQIKDHPVRVMRLLELMALDSEGYTNLLEAVARDGEDLGVAFIDHYTTRPLHPMFLGLGWVEENDLNGTLVPGLFQPLVRARRTLNVALRLLGQSALQGRDPMSYLYMVKSDGDQDRPS